VLKTVSPFVVRQLVFFLNELQITTFVLRGNLRNLCSCTLFAFQEHALLRGGRLVHFLFDLTYYSLMTLFPTLLFSYFYCSVNQVAVIQ